MSRCSDPLRFARQVAITLWLAAVGGTAIAGQVTAQAAVERRAAEGGIFVGESFTFQIQVRGSDEPEPLDVSGIEDFRVEPLGGQKNNSESVTIINRQVSRVVRRGYLFGYRLTPKRAGALTIPAIAVSAEGQAAHTRPLTIQVREPQETDDLKLRLTLDKPRCYVGEPVLLTVTWYLRKDVRAFAFQLPVLEDARFATDAPEVQVDDPRQYVRAQVGDGEVIARKSQATLDGKQWLAVSFQKVLIPKHAGTFTLPSARLACDARVGTRRRRGPFDSIFDDPFFDDPFDRGVYQRFVIPSDRPTLEVVALPREGRPAGFTGLVGAYRIEASAAPIEVSVGDPITLTVRVSGPPYVKHVELPPLAEQPALARDFKIPAERAEGKVEDGAKVFTQTLRALRPDVTAVPPVELPYFDTEAGAYRVARTEPIPLTVHATRVVTAEHAEGREPTSPAHAELKARAEGIMANYEDLSVLESQHHGLATAARDPLWLSVTGVPFLAYLVVLVATAIVRRRKADPAAREATRAYAALSRELKAARRKAGEAPAVCEGVLAAFRGYLGKKLRTPAAAITWRDVEPLLRERGAAAEALEGLRTLFEQCEAGRYAGGVALDDPARFLDEARRLARALDRSLT